MTQAGTHLNSSPTVIKDSTAAQLSDWLKQARRGNRAAFGRIAEYYQRPIFNLCYRMLGQAAEAEDAAQETFLRAYLKLNTYDENRKFSTWLFAIANHHCLDRLRRKKYTFIDWEELPDQDLGSIERLSPLQPEQAAVQTETERTIRTLLQGLPAEYRAVIILKYWYGKSCEEIAEITKSQSATVKSRLFRARQRLAQRINPTDQVGRSVSSLFGPYQRGLA
jgi:RNA polymerase sigma-70 factor (ECF subfamily)